MMQVNPDGASGQLVNVKTNQVLSLKGISDWELGSEDSQGYFTIYGARGSIYDSSKMEPVAWENDGKLVGVSNRDGADNQRFKFVPLDT